jgi:dienelactone hydrolase
MKYFILAMTLLLGPTTMSMAAIKGEEVTYKVGAKDFKGYLAYDDAASAKRPGVIVVHEWWGYNEYARKRADMLAQLGYVALAIDMYGEGKKADHPNDAAAFMQEATKSEDVTQERFMAGYKVLENFKFTDPGRIAAIGYCFGGGTVLKMAMSGMDLAGVVSFHGALPDLKPKSGEVTAKILVCHGAEDQMVKPEQLASFKKSLDQAGADYQVKIYDGAKHSFTNPDADALAAKFDMPVGYNAKADADSWKDMKDFLNQVF